MSPTRRQPAANACGKAILSLIPLSLCPSLPVAVGKLISVEVTASQLSLHGGLNADSHPQNVILRIPQNAVQKYKRALPRHDGTSTCIDIPGNLVAFTPHAKNRPFLCGEHTNPKSERTTNNPRQERRKATSKIKATAIAWESCSQASASSEASTSAWTSAGTWL